MAMYSKTGLKIMSFLKNQLKTELPEEDWETIGYAITQYWGENEELAQQQVKSVGLADVGGSLPSDEEIRKQIYRHLNSLPYAGGYPSNWRDTLSENIGKWLRGKQQ